MRRYVIFDILKMLPYHSNYVKVIWYSLAILHLITGLLTIDCASPYDAPVTTPGSVIQSPNYPSSYEPGKHCRITIKYSSSIILRFLNFDVQACNTSCDCDYLIIYDGPDDSSSQIGARLCGKTIPTEMKSSGNTMQILFHTDGSVQDTGFRIEIIEFGMLIIKC